MVKKLSIRERALQAISESPAPPVTASESGTGSPLISKPVEPKMPRTGPGTTMMFMERQSSTFTENQELKAQLQELSNSLPVRKLAPSSIVPSKWANRHSDSFTLEGFASLKAEIETAGGNVQPIKVRPTLHSDPQQYEIVFGHRRHRACSELGLPVLSMIESIDDRALFLEMDRENKERADLRPFEQGEMYRRALDAGLYPSLRALAAAVGLQSSNVSQAVQIARLPMQVLDAFPSRLDIQYRWSAPLSAAVGHAPDVVIGIASDIISCRVGGEKLPANAVFARLTGAEIQEKSKLASRKIKVNGKEIALLKRSGSKVALEIPVLSKAQEKELETLLMSFFS